MASVAVLVVGCHEPRPPAPVTSAARTTGAKLGSPSNDDAVMRIATARCERELACDKIGVGRAHEDMPTCLERMGALMAGEAGTNVCPSGVDPMSVSSCLFDIQRTRCGGELEVETNLPSCTSALLCLR